MSVAVGERSLLPMARPSKIDSQARRLQGSIENGVLLLVDPNGPIYAAPMALELRAPAGVIPTSHPRPASQRQVPSSAPDNRPQDPSLPNTCTSY